MLQSLFRLRQGFSGQVGNRESAMARDYANLAVVKRETVRRGG